MTGLRFEPLEAFAAIREPGADPLVRDAAGGTAVATGSGVVVFGTGGAGKTTWAIDVLVHLAAGLDWCGVLFPARPIRALLIENEGPRPMMRDKLAAKLAAWHGPTIASRVQVLAEPWGRFSFRDEGQRAELVAAIDSHQADLLVVGPVSRIGMEGGGTADEIRAFMQLVEDVQACAAAPVAHLLVHHENRAGQVSGAWDGVPDTLVHIQGLGRGRTRVFWQKTRWSSHLHGTTTNLVWADGATFTVEQREEITEDTIASGLLAAVRELPGGSWSKIRAQVKGNATDSARVRDRLIAAGQLVNGAAREGYFNLWCADDPASPRSEVRTALERLPFPSADGAPETTRSPVPDVSRNGERNGTGGPGSHDETEPPSGALDEVGV